jgi:hypothetical protein
VLVVREFLPLHAQRPGFYIRLNPQTRPWTGLRRLLQGVFQCRFAWALFVQNIRINSTAAHVPDIEVEEQSLEVVIRINSSLPNQRHC